MPGEDTAISTRQSGKRPREEPQIAGELGEMGQGYPSYRWVILGLVFLATMVNYADRIVLSVASTEVIRSLELDPVEYGHVLAAFGFMYAVGFLFVGKLIDKLGTKLGYLAAMVSWSVAGALAGLSGSMMSLACMRGLLGITASGNFPAAIKSVAEWFHPKQRALATALFNSGPHVALVAGPPVIAALTLWVGWRAMFAIVGLAGLPLALVWQVLYKHPAHLDQTQAAQEAERPAVKPIRWRDMLGDVRLWAIMIVKFLTDGVWWFYIFWLPPLLKEKYGFDIKGIGWAMPVVYAIAIVLANVAGWYTGHLIGKGWSHFRARKWVMLLCAACLPVTALSGFTPYPVVVILLVALAAGAHSGWAANTFSLMSDCFPTRAVASVAGLGGFAGGVGGIFISALVPGFIVKFWGYAPALVMMAVLHPLAFVMVQFMIKAPRDVCKEGD
ncbi:MAG: MFS transporter [Sedimentisphaerales bacterium]|nr:MFS transporter [Sedimentisphaerales bacterium]